MDWKLRNNRENSYLPKERVLLKYVSWKPRKIVMHIHVAVSTRPF